MLQVLHTSKVIFLGKHGITEGHDVIKWAGYLREALTVAVARLLGVWRMWASCWWSSEKDEVLSGCGL